MYGYCLNLLVKGAEKFVPKQFINKNYKDRDK